MSDKLEEMEKAAADDTYDTLYGQGVYSAPPSGSGSAAARRTGGSIYGSVYGRGR